MFFLLLLVLKLLLLSYPYNGNEHKVQHVL
nr:MAG TPA: hypothetical protein [Caudoviricetes sp.]DAV79448.1 MAG TPA: hypothetical protein [Caudoviricetes sp.]